MKNTNHTRDETNCTSKGCLNIWLNNIPARAKYSERDFLRAQVRVIGMNMANYDSSKSEFYKRNIYLEEINSGIEFLEKYINLIGSRTI